MSLPDTIESLTNPLQNYLTIKRLELLEHSPFSSDHVPFEFTRIFHVRLKQKWGWFFSGDNLHRVWVNKCAKISIEIGMRGRRDLLIMSEIFEKKKKITNKTVLQIFPNAHCILTTLCFL